GQNTYASGTNSIAIGSGVTGSTTQSQGASSIALGYSAYAATTNSIAIGTGSNSGAANAVAIGNGSYAGQANTIILGDASNSSLYVGLGTATPTQKLDVNGNLKFSGALMPNNNAGTSGYVLTSQGAGTAPIWSAAASGWSLSGNASTTPGTNFIGTTDAKDVVFKTGGTERLRIVNGVSASTGTAGDVTLGDANSGTVRSNKEMVMREDGDTYGPSVLRLRNRNGENGAIFETIGASAALVDFLFKTGTTATPLVSNIRFETRNTGLFSTGNTMEWQIGQAADPTLVVSAATTGNSSLLKGNFGIGKAVPTQKLDVSGNISADNTIYVDATGTNTGSSTPGLVFGASTSGESIASKRNAGGNQNGIDFYTASNSRMSISNGGNVGIATTTPTSTFQNTGSFSQSIITTSSNYTALSTDYTIVCNSGFFSRTITLPTAVGITGRIYVIKRTGSTTVTIDAYSTQTIDGTTTKSLSTSYSQMTVQSDGSNWIILSN
ncbi:MAG: hypothetical protein ABI091_21510, partial [Ferruginibacter sp.]